MAYAPHIVEQVQLECLINTRYRCCSCSTLHIAQALLYALVTFLHLSFYSVYKNGQQKDGPCVRKSCTRTEHTFACGCILKTSGKSTLCKRYAFLCDRWLPYLEVQWRFVLVTSGDANCWAAFFKIPSTYEIIDETTFTTRQTRRAFLPRNISPIFYDLFAYEITLWAVKRFVFEIMHPPRSRTDSKITTVFTKRATKHSRVSAAKTSDYLYYFS